MNEKILEEYSVRVYEIDPFFICITQKKIKIDKNRCEYISSRIDIYFTKCLLAVEIDEQNYEGRELTFEKKRQEALEKKLGCKFIIINTSDAERAYDTDYEATKIQILLSKFKNKKIKQLEKQSNKLKIKQEDKVKELQDEIKKLRLQLTNQSAQNELTKNVLPNYKKWKTHNQK